MTVLARLQSAESGDRGLDILIGEYLDWKTDDGDLNVRRSLAIYGLEQFIVRVSAYNNGWRTALPNWTTSLDAALALAERMHPGWAWELTIEPSSATAQGASEMWLEGQVALDIGGVHQTAATPALALCTAVLSAMEKNP